MYKGFEDGQLPEYAGHDEKALRKILHGHGFGCVHRLNAAKLIRKHYGSPEAASACLALKQRLVGAWISREATATAFLAFAPDYRFEYHLVYLKGELTGSFEIGFDLTRHQVQDHKAGVYLPAGTPEKGTIELYYDRSAALHRVSVRPGGLKDLAARKYVPA